MDDRVVRLVAHHSCAVHEARVRGLDRELLTEFVREDSVTYDALVYCDMTTGPGGELVEFLDRMDEIERRYGSEHEVTRALHLGRADLTLCCRRTAERLYREFKKLLGKAGLPPVRLHDLRHTAASLLIAQGVPARVVMKILGHSQIALTMNTYSHVAPEVSREAADRMAQVLWQDDDEDQADKAGTSESNDGQEDDE